MEKQQTPPLVSVIIPTYNRKGPTLEAAASVLGQTFRDFELLLVDDGSEDGTEAAFLGRGFGPEEGAALRYLRLAHLGMPGAVRNRGAACARGKYLAFLDSDDLWAETKLEKQVRLMEGSNAAGETVRPRLSHTRELWLRNGKVVSQAGQKHERQGDLFAASLRKCVIGPSTVLLERSLFEETGGFREDLEIAEDYEFWLRITCREPVAYLDEQLTTKRAGAGDQLSEKYGQIEIFRLRALRDLLEGGFFPLSGGRRKAAAAEFAKKCAIYAAGCRKRGKTGEAEEFEALATRWTRDFGAPPI